MCYTYNGGSMKKNIFVVFVCLYFCMIIFVTYLLLSYNKYNIASIGNYYMTYINSEIDEYDTNDLLLIKKSDVKTNDVILYCDSTNLPLAIKKDKIKSIDANNVILLDSSITITDENVIGKIDNIVSYNYLGSIYSFLVSKWGYLIVIIFPILIAFIYEIFAIIKEVRK